MAQYEDFKSITDIILQKVFRTKQIEDNRGAVSVSEGIDANYMDMVNYSIFLTIKMEKVVMQWREQAGGIRSYMEEDGFETDQGSKAWRVFCLVLQIIVGATFIFSGLMKGQSMEPRLKD